MQSEDFDHKVREAARQHRPAFDETAWEKMQGVLDKHLPEKKDNRRPIFFFLLAFLLLGGGVWMMVAKPWQHPSTANTIVKDNLQKESGGPSWATSPSAETRGNEKDDLVTDLTIVSHLPVEIKTKPGSEKKNKNVPVTQNLITEQVHAAPHNPEQTILNPILPSFTETGNTEKKNAAEPAIETPAKLLVIEPAINPLIQAGEIASAIKKENKTKRNSFSFSISLGAGSSSSEGGSIGRIKPTLGAGITYTIKDRFSIRSGFYSGHKVYVSEPYEYHPPDVFWTYYPNLKQVNADCKIYEIPLSLAWHFGQSSRQNWFASAGVSSYIMKKETYQFLYKNSSGQLNTRTWDFNDKNQHFFSTLTLSGGYQRSLNKTLSVSIEPYLKLPLTGIGYGKVKLSSAGVLFSLDYKPFRKN
ncbi:MAG TPA: hypothetical protein VLJ68_10510 [Chitinophagaceae bacterium]|nr:hypothetical protein [Chitinophagaceae bacterium]